MYKNKNLIIRSLAAILLCTIVIQILLGAWVRLTGSGMSCPDWPLCYGFFFPTPEKVFSLGFVEYTYFQIFLEWIHRANAAFLIGPLSILLFIYIILNNKMEKKIKKFSYYLIVMLGIQGLLGGLTVFKSNIPWSVAIHLASAFLLLYVVLNIFLLTFKKIKFRFIATKSLKNLLFTSGLLVLITASAGAFTSKYGASLSCASWPLCNNSFFPNINDQFEVIHFAHRVLAFLLVFLLVIVFLRLLKFKNYMFFTGRIFLFLIPIIILLQVLIGAFLITFQVPIWMGIFHQFMGLLLFSNLIILFFYIKKSVN